MQLFDILNDLFLQAPQNAGEAFPKNALAHRFTRPGEQVIVFNSLSANLMSSRV